MKIAFNALGCGLGNNGGTRTIILCDKVMKELGHQSWIISSLNCFTWFKYDKPIRLVPNDLDALISIDKRGLKSTINSNAKVKMWYTRAFQGMDFSNLEIKIIANSENLRNRIMNSGAKQCEVIYQGIDFNLWENIDRDRKDKIRIGCLFSNKPQKNWKDFEEIASRLDPLKYEFVTFGSQECRCNWIKSALVNPNHKDLSRLYQSCDIWLAPTKNEGLHNVPMEASLSGCLIICGDYEGNGMLGDYAIEDKTCMVYHSIEDAIDKIKNPNWDLVENMNYLLKEKIGTREENMKKMIRIIESELRSK